MYSLTRVSTVQQAAIVIESARVALEILARLELQAVDEDARHHRTAMAAREAGEREVPVMEVAHGRHERHGSCCGDCGAKGGNVAEDFHHPRLKNSRLLFMARMCDTSSSKSPSRSTKLRLPEFTISTGAAA